MKNLLVLTRRASEMLWRIVNGLVESLQTVRRAQTLAVLVCSGLASLVLVTALVSARGARDKWDLAARVVVTSRWVGADEPLGAHNTRAIEVPSALAADDALAAVPNGANLRVDLAPNTALTESMIVAAAGTVAVPDDWRVVAMGVDVTALVLVPGDRVDVVSADKVLATGAIVTVAATDAQGPAVAVPRDVAAVVATAARDGLASLVLAR